MEQQIAEVEAERDRVARSGAKLSIGDISEGDGDARAAAAIATLTRLKGLGKNDATLLIHEIFYRGFSQSPGARELGRSDAHSLGERGHATGPGDQSRRASLDPGPARSNGMALVALSARKRAFDMV